VGSLSARERAALPDSAFAYVDSAGRRRLPIHDAAHVRNALARFNQVAFEDDAARDRARTRLLRAAQRHGVMPIGFIRAQLEPQRRFPKGHVTFLLTDIESSTELLARLGDGYAALLARMRKLVRDAVKRAGGQEVDSRADEVFSVFARADAALAAAIEIQRAIAAADWPDGTGLRLRAALHRGRPTLTETGYVGLAVHAAARLCFAAHGGQILVTSSVRAGLEEELPEGVSLAELGAWHFRGLPEALELFEVEAAELLRGFPPPREGVLAAAV
jgi:class 3 adenylate cyclase